MRRRLDAELVRRGLARSREHARELVESGEVLVNLVASTKVTRQVEDSDSIKLAAVGDNWVSRGAHKLLGALAHFEPQGLTVANRVALDAGASTGGFTQVLLSKDVQSVFAVDVGYGQLAWSVRQSERVVVIERTNVRNLTQESFEPQPELVVADLSFISLRTVLPAMVAASARAADFVLMVKPQFEVGRELVGEGVVRDPLLRSQAVLAVVTAAKELGLQLRSVIASPLPGPEGNVEYFVWLSATAPELAQNEVEELVAEAVRSGPQ